MLNNSAVPTTNVKMADAPAGLPCQSKIVGGARIRILAIGVYRMNVWSGAVSSLSLDFIEQWDELLAEMNAGKRGRPFQYPEPFVAWMACIHVFLQMPYRQMEGFVRKLTEFIPRLTAADYTTLFRRIQRLDLSLIVAPELLAEDVIIAVDSTGFQVTNRGEWMREKWQVRRGWIKVHAMIDVETNQVLGLEVTDESVPDDRMFVPLLDQVRTTAARSTRCTGCLAMEPMTETGSSMPSNTGVSSPGSRHGRMQQPIRRDHPIGLSVSGTGSDGEGIGCGRG